MGTKIIIQITQITNLVPINACNILITPLVTLHQIIQQKPLATVLFYMRIVGLEPTRSHPRKILSLVRLPIPPYPLTGLECLSAFQTEFYIIIIRAILQQFLFISRSFSDQFFSNVKTVKCSKIICRCLSTADHPGSAVFLQKDLR